MGRVDGDVAVTGRLTLILAILLAVTIPVATLTSWNRVGRSGSPRGSWSEPDFRRFGSGHSQRRTGSMGHSAKVFVYE
jgi:hypothetical protein